jgi:NDP-sugar pyrophosphorylase family protein
MDAGYRTPKPLIKVVGQPMVVRAAECLPPADKWIFVCLQDHIRRAAIDEVLKDRFPGSDIVPVNSTTEGQVCTCLLARHLLEEDDMLTIGACDNAMTYSQKAWEEMWHVGGTDCVVWTFRNSPAVLHDPTMYGWVDVGEQDLVQRVSCKVPISSSPMSDHAVIGAFTFSKASDFLNCADRLISQQRRIRNEFYVDELMNVSIESGMTCRPFEVDRYVCWGTPQDLETFEYWRGFFSESELGERC